MKITEIITEAANAAQQAAIAISMKKAHKKPKNESTELEEEFDTQIPDEQAEKIHTVGQAVDFINKNLSSSKDK